MSKKNKPRETAPDPARYVSAQLSHFVVLDFEATCDDVHPPNPQEIIEFPSVLLDANTFEVVDEFESFVRPVHTKLTKFCTELTSITQAQVDAAPPFPEVFAAHQDWLASHDLPTAGGDLPYVIVTCGDWDLLTMLPAQLAALDPPATFVPTPYRQWLNVKVPFKAWHRKQARAGMARMLDLLGIELVGHHHRGIDDSRNIAKILRALAARNQTLRPTAALAASRYPTIDLTLTRDGETEPLTLNRRVLKTLLGGASAVFRRQATRAWLGERELREDADLHDLRQGDTLRIG